MKIYLVREIMAILESIKEKILLDILEHKLSTKCIAIKHGVSESAVSKVKCEYGIKFPRRAGLLKVNENYFETIDTPDKAYFLGFITGDGTIVSKTYVLHLGLHEDDIEILEKFKECLESEHTLRKAEYKSKNKKLFKGCFISISCKKIYDDLLYRHGVGSEKSKILKFPNTVSENLMPHYVRGLFDSDGGWVFTPINGSPGSQFDICSSVYSFVDELQNFLVKKLGLTKTKIVNRGNTCFSVHYGGNQQCKILYDYIYNCGGIRLERKYKKATNYFTDEKTIACMNRRILKRKPKLYSSRKLVEQQEKILSDLFTIFSGR